MSDNCRKCGRFLAKHNLILCDRRNKILSEWVKKNLGRYTIQQMKEIRHRWYSGTPLLTRERGRCLKNG